MALSLPPPHAGRVVEQLRASGAQHQDRHAAREIDDVVEQIEQHRLGPLQIVDVQDHWSLPRERFEQAADFEEQLLGNRHATAAQTLEHVTRRFGDRRECLDQWPERDPLPVVKTATAQHHRRRPHPRRQL